MIFLNESLGNMAQTLISYLVLQNYNYAYYIFLFFISVAFKINRIFIYNVDIYDCNKYKVLMHQCIYNNIFNSILSVTFSSVYFCSEVSFPYNKKQSTSIMLCMLLSGS